MQIRFEWDSIKAAVNLRKHGVSFEDATLAFGEDDEGTEIIRIISARAADRKERKRYEDQNR